MVDEKTKQLMTDGIFSVPDFEGIWMECKGLYENLGFRDNITDMEMISEFKYISQQLRKYIFSKQDEILSQNTYREMLEIVDNLIAKAKEYGDSRREIAYNFMRDHWLLSLHNILSMLMSNEENQEEVDYE